MGILHDVEDALTVIAAPAESVEEICQPVLVQCPREQQTRCDGQ